MVVTADVTAAVTVVAVRGTWTRALRMNSFAAIKKALTEHPAALVIDLSALVDPQAASSSTWLTVSRVGAAMEPPVRVAAALPPHGSLSARLVRLGAAYSLPMFENVAEAGASAVAGGPTGDRMRLDLPAHPDTPALARNLVTDACCAWGLHDVLHLARLVMSELAGNAIEHARTRISVAVVRRGDGVHLTVTDGDPRMPQLLEQTEKPSGSLWEARGMGLRTVQAASTAWGALPTQEGKVVWATVRPA